MQQHYHMVLASLNKYVEYLSTLTTHHNLQTKKTEKKKKGDSNWSVYVLVAQLCQTLCDSMDCSLPGPSARGILQARILEWVDIPFSRSWRQASKIL